MMVAVSGSFGLNILIGILLEYFLTERTAEIIFFALIGDADLCLISVDFLPTHRISQHHFPLPKDESTFPMINRLRSKNVN